jgi:hypothetical protein
MTQKEYMRSYYLRRRASLTPEQLDAERAAARKSAKLRYHRNREELKIRAKLSRDKHKARRLADTRKWRATNKAHVSAYNKKWHSDNPELTKALGREWRANNKERRNEQNAQRYRSDVAYRLEVSLRTRIRTALRKRLIYNKESPTADLLGCSIDDLIRHLESKFQPGMSWDNHGKWHIDHIRPCASFDLNNAEEQRLCFHFSNLQPLWAHDNLRKHCKWQPDQIAA